MSPARTFKFALAAILAAAALNLPGTALAQDYENSTIQEYKAASPTTISGTYTNHPSGQITATSDNDGPIAALTVDEFDNSGTVSATVSVSGSGSGSGIVAYGDFTNSGTVNASGSGSGTGYGYGIVASGGFTNSGTANASGDGYGYGIVVRGGNFTNDGTVNASGSDSGYGIYVDSGGFTSSGTLTATGDGTGYGISVYGGYFTNSGTLTATGTGYGYGIAASGGFTNSGTVNASGSGSGYGIYVSGDFTNSGTVTATGSDYGSGISVYSGDFTNSGTVTATGDGNGYGISVYGGDFTNSGTVTATGDGNGYGISTYGGNFTNSGTVNATGDDNGRGIYVYGGNFTNNGTLSLTSNGGGTALYFFPTSSLTPTFTAESGSNLIIAGANPAIIFDNYYNKAGILSISAGAGLTIMGVNGFGDGSQSFVVAQNVTDTGPSTFETADSAVFSYGHGWVDSGNGSSGDYTVKVTREGWASEMTGGEGGKFVSNLEDYFISNGTNVESGSSAESWLNLLDDINSGSTRAEVKRRGQDGARLNTAQATGQSLRLVQDASRRVGSIFNKELSGQLREGTAPAAGGGGSSTSVWFSPFYLTANQDSSDRSISSVDGDWWGFSLGAGYSPQDNLNFGLGFHFLKGDVDAGRAYEADSTAWGLDLGFAANLGSGRYRPLLTGTVSHTRHDYDQTRRADGYAYKSSPEIKVTTAALGLSQDFHPTGADTFIIRPKIGFDWTRTDMESYRERGSGPRALDVDSEKYDSYRSEVGTALVWKPTAPLELELRAAWLHDFGDRSPILTSVARDLSGLSLYTPRSDNKRDSAALGASASFDAGSGFSLGLDYDGQFNSDLDSHQIWGSLKFSF